MSETRYYI